MKNHAPEHWKQKPVKPCSKPKAKPKAQPKIENAVYVQTSPPVNLTQEASNTQNNHNSLHMK